MIIRKGFPLKFTSGRNSDNPARKPKGFRIQLGYSNKRC